MRVPELIKLLQALPPEHSNGVVYWRHVDSDGHACRKHVGKIMVDVGATLQFMGPALKPGRFVAIELSIAGNDESRR